MKLSLGLCGLPNSGKSTFIKLLTQLEVAIGPYPFTTLRSQEYAVPVITDELKSLHSLTQTQKIIPPSLFFVDVPGLIRNAHQGEGLGNEFLSYLRGCDAIIEIVRNFRREDVPHVEGSVDPIRDIFIIEDEIFFADRKIIERQLKLNRGMTKIDHNLKKIFDLLEAGKRFPHIENEFKKFNFLVTKDWFLLINGDCSDDILENEKLNFFKGRYCLDFEWELELKNNQEINEEFGSRVETFFQKLKKDLNLIQFFTFNDEITQGWFAFRGQKLINVVEQIHSDFAKKFKMAEAIDLADFLRARSWEEARKLGLIKNKGREAEIEENEIIFVKI
ncbi:MAG: DUF933 domain-containing protein [Patescibacteria group bacterium]|nr:DUF933 domain-containing protein [Patescibacteria group bacterium]